MILSTLARKIRTLQSDFPGVVNHKLRELRLSCKVVYCTFITGILCRLKGIELGKGCRFYGIPVFVRQQHSTIRIGNNVSFRSDFTSNLVGINRRCIVATHAQGAVIEVGDNSGLSGTVIGASEKIILGQDVLCGANVLITDFDWHHVDPKKRRLSEGIPSRPVTVQDNVWLGLNVVVLKGVTIGENSVIGANSVVNRDIGANVVAAGNPCKVVKSL